MVGGAVYSFSEFWKANDLGGVSDCAGGAGVPDLDVLAAGEGGDVGILESPFARQVADLDASDCRRLDVEIGREIARWEAARLVVRARFAQLRPPELDGGEQRYQAFDEFAGDELAAELKLSPAAGKVVEVVSRRFPSAVLARHVRVRNLTRIFPGCDKPSTACDLDHIRPHGQDGETGERNLGPECRRHHRLKHAADRPFGAAHPLRTTRRCGGGCIRKNPDISSGRVLKVRRTTWVRSAMAKTDRAWAPIRRME